MTNFLNNSRKPHAVLDLPSRAWKAAKIEHLLGLTATPKPLKLLEIGTGSGGIAHYFAHHPNIRFQVTAVDVVDQRQIHDGYKFLLVESTHLPFDDDSFDIVISNHVIEHVGDAAAQRHHLSEMRRVMKTGGVGYLAVPNRWMPVEPHYRLAFLSWLPATWRTPYLRWRRRGSCYDCNPPTKPQLEAMLSAAGFDFQFLSSRAIAVMRDIEKRGDLLFRLAAGIPKWIWDWFGYVNPTLIYRLEKRA